MCFRCFWIRNSRVDVHTDSRALLGSWQSEGGINTEINDRLRLFCDAAKSSTLRLTCNTFLRLRTRPTLPRVVSQTSIVPFRRRRGPMSRDCLGHIPLISCRSTATAAVIYMVIVFHISHRATPLSHPASTCLRNSCLSGKTFRFFPPLYLSVRSSVSLLTSIISTPSRQSCRISSPSVLVGVIASHEH